MKKKAVHKNSKHIAHHQGRAKKTWYTKRFLWLSISIAAVLFALITSSYIYIGRQTHVLGAQIAMLSGGSECNVGSPVGSSYCIGVNRYQNYYTSKVTCAYARRIKNYNDPSCGYKPQCKIDAKNTVYTTYHEQCGTSKTTCPFIHSDHLVKVYIANNTKLCTRNKCVDEGQVIGRCGYPPSDDRPERPLNKKNDHITISKPTGSSCTTDGDFDVTFSINTSYAISNVILYDSLIVIDSPKINPTEIGIDTTEQGSAPYKKYKGEFTIFANGLNSSSLRTGQKIYFHVTGNTDKYISGGTEVIGDLIKSNQQTVTYPGCVKKSNKQ